MTTLSLTTTGATAPSGYFLGVARAARALAKAVLTPPACPAVARVRDQVALLRLAQQYQHTAPALAQELRTISCRD